MKNKTTKKPKVSPKKKPAKKALPKLMKKLQASLKKPQRMGRLTVSGTNVPGRFVVTAPAPEPPKYSAPWRAGIDWAAAGRKAYETKMRNQAARAAGIAAEPPSVQKAARALDVALQADKKARRSKFRKQMAAPSVALKEEDTSRS